MHRNAALATLAVVLLVAVAGCTGADTTETPGEPTPGGETVAQTATPSPSETETPTPEAVQTTASETPSGANPVALNVETRQWDDSRTIVGNVTTATVRMPQLNDQTRRIWVYVPPNYTTSTAEYPVVYMQDGANLFDRAASFAGEWRVDETMQRLARDGGPAAIVVGVENAGQDRGEEYLPWRAGDLGGDGEAYAAFLAETLKPTIDAHYRTDTDETAVVGSSLGGVISLYTAFEYPEQFQYAGGMSNAHMYTPQIYGWLNETGAGPERVYLDWGTAEGSNPETVVEANERLAGTIDAVGYVRGETLLTVEDEGGIHRESAWRERFPRAIEWLLTGED